MRWLFEEELEEERGRLDDALSQAGVSAQTWRPLAEAGAKPAKEPRRPPPPRARRGRPRKRSRRDSLWITIAAASFAAAVGVLSALLVVGKRGEDSAASDLSSAAVEQAAPVVEVIEAVEVVEESVDPQPAPGELSEEPAAAPPAPSEEGGTEPGASAVGARPQQRPSMRSARRAGR